MYDTIIIGAGPAGLTAALYLLRAGKTVLMLDEGIAGGKLNEILKIENIPGFESISGFDFTEKLYNQVTNLISDGISDICLGEAVAEVSRSETGEITVVTDLNNKFVGKTLIIASGTTYRTLGLDHEEELVGRGIHYCATCDGAFYKDKDVIVVGGGNSAVTEALQLADIARSVTIVQNLSELTCEATLLDRLSTKQNVKVICNTTVTGYMIQDGKFSGIKAKLTGEDAEIHADGAFICIGMAPSNSIFTKLVDCNSAGYIVTDRNCRTRTENVFAAGSCTDEKVNQVVVACGSGCKAALEAVEYLRGAK